MPPTFSYPVGASRPTDVWVPYVVPEDQRVRGNDYGYYLTVIGRLRDGVSLERAQLRMDQITAGLAVAAPSWFAGRVTKVEALQTFLTRGVRTWMLMLLGAVAFVMLIGCVNLASLMLVRAIARTRELGIRSALGASRRDLIRALLVDSLVLSVTGGALGVFVRIEAGHDAFGVAGTGPINSGSPPSCSGDRGCTAAFPRARGASRRGS
jgi:putative ABC transport system permease protein